MEDSGTGQVVEGFLPLTGKNVVLGVTGSIAAYKAADLTSKLVQAGAQVDVILTASAQEFIGKATFSALTHRPVTTSLWEANSPLAIDHVSLAVNADCLVVAPATAHTIAKLALGISDNPLVATGLATSAPMVIAPAMDANMFQHPAVQANVNTLRQRGAAIVGPGAGRLASGMVGWGRMAEPAEIFDIVRQVIGRKGDYAGRKVVVSAGGTQEPIDPVRVITNRSTGKMGYAIAVAARDRGAEVVLVTGPTALANPGGIRVISAKTVKDMRDAVLPESEDADLLVMAAAISDFSPAHIAPEKIKKGADGISLELVKNEDWMPLVKGPKLVKVSFAAETGDAASKARTKVASKGAVFSVANDVSEPGSGFGTDTNRVAFVDANGDIEQMPLMDKLAVAHAILDRALKYLT
jgi:phosphopantothenoylcysteine decarboxylase/phosphopantothenate--cysteine ligase